MSMVVLMEVCVHEGLFAGNGPVVAGVLDDAGGDGKAMGLEGQLEGLALPAREGGQQHG